MNTKRIGILGGGQLGKMMGIAAQPLDLDFWILDKSLDFPAAHSCTHFVEGDFTNYEDVMAFGRQVDIIGIEIEGVNDQALQDLENEGKNVIPSSASLKIIKDKGLQKQFYKKYNLPTASFKLYDGPDDISDAVATGSLVYPFVQKVRKGGYDGQGVSIIKSSESKLLRASSLVENLVDIKKEIAILAARNQSGQIHIYDPVEMVFNEEANLVDYLFCPAQLTLETQVKAKFLVSKLINEMDIVGLLAVEMFETNKGELLINEVAPRPHNSGHHTIEAAMTSQFEQQLRCLLNLPLGGTALRSPAIMINILGAYAYTGKPIYDGISEVMAMENVYVHLYGKKETRPFRKMGHITILCDSIESGLQKKEKIQKKLRVIA